MGLRALSDGEDGAAASVAQESGGGGALCEEVCSNTTPCNRKCTYDGVIMTCGNYGTCEPENQPCHYAAVTGEQACLIQGDVHVWGVRVELHSERYYADVNNNPNCPAFWHNWVSQYRDCWAEYIPSACCPITYNQQLCDAYWQPGICH